MLPDVLGVAWVVVAAGVVMAPALAHGWSLGPYDQLSQFGLSKSSHLVLSGSLHPVFHNTQISDLFREFIPWTTLAWTQVHNGLLPLWNPYSALGAPLAFNWQSATFSLPALLGYLFPVRLDFTVQVLVTLVVAGTGTYVLGRVMRLGVLGAAMAATVFELSGSFMALLGWPIASVMSWAGWLFACAILIIRGEHRLRYVILFAVALALSIYAGQPDTLIVLIVGLVVFLVVMLAIRVHRMGLSAVTRPVIDLVAGSIAGLGLAAPLLLPAAQLSMGSIRGVGRSSGFPPDYLLNLVFQKFNGLPLDGALTFSFTDLHGLNYVPTAVYVGAIAMVLAAVAVITRSRRATVVALGCVVLVEGCLVYLPPLVSLLNGLPGLGEVRWVRAIQVLAFALAVLAGVGLDVVVRSNANRSVRLWLGVGFGSAAVFLLVVWAFGRGQLSPVDAAIRARSFIWPAAEVVVGLLVFGFLVLIDRRSQKPNGLFSNPGRIAGTVLLICSTGFLVALGLPWWPSSPRSLAASAPEIQLQKAVGSSIVGFGAPSCFYPPTLGILPDVNVALGVHELDSYDPLIPEDLFDSWESTTGRIPRPAAVYVYPIPVSMFCPVVSTVATARMFGVGFILEPHGVKGPPGTIYDMKLGNEGLWRVPRSSVATLTPLGPHHSFPPVRAGGTPIPVIYPSPTSWKVTTQSATPQVLRLRLTDVPGWHASIDGKPLKLIRFNRVMMQARIPAGRHTVELHYWPEAFSAGLVLAGVTVIAFVVLFLYQRRRRHPGGRVAGA